MDEDSGDQDIFDKSREGSAARKNNQIDSLRESENLDNAGGSHNNSFSRNTNVGRRSSNEVSTVPRLPSINIRKMTIPIIEETP